MAFQNILKVLTIALYLLLNFSTSDCELECDLYFQFSKVCNRFDYKDKLCFPWDSSLCKVVKTTYNDYKCPTFYCVSQKLVTRTTISQDSTEQIHIGI